MKNIMKIISYVIAFFAGASALYAWLTTAEGKEDLAELLQEAGWGYLANEIVDDGQPLARTIAAYEQRDREARFAQSLGKTIDRTWWLGPR